MKKAFDIVVTVFMIIVILLAFLLVGVRVFGLKPYTVISGSMEPEYHVGSLVYVKKAGMAELDVDVPITYTINGGTVVTHRIIEVIVDPDNPTSVKYITKGDANEDPDGEPVRYENVIGRPVFSIPLLGYVSFYLRTPIGAMLAASVMALLFVLAFIPDLIRRIIQSEKPAPADGSIEDVKDLIDTMKNGAPPPDGEAK